MARKPPKRKTKKSATKKAPARKEKTPAEQAVEKFEAAKKEMHEFMEENVEMIEELRRLVENYNASCSESAKAVKSQLQNSQARRLVIGAFGAIKKNNDYWDGHKISALFPREVADAVLEETIKYIVDVKLLDQLQRQGEVDSELARQAFVTKPPTLSMMPGCPKELRF